MAAWTAYVPIIFSLAAVAFTYFGLYLRAIDKVDDLRKELDKQRKEDVDTINISLKSLRDLLQTLTIQQVKAETRCEENNKKTDLVSGIDNRLSKMEAQNAIYFKTIDPFLAAAIHSPIHVERDSSMEKLEANELSDEEAKQLEQELENSLQEEKNGKKASLKTVALGSVRRVIVGYEFDQI